MAAISPRTPEQRSVLVRASNSHFGMNRHESRVLMKQANAKCRMPKETRSQDRSVGVNPVIVRSRVAKKRSGTLRTASLPVDGRPSSVRDVRCNRAFGQWPVPFQGGTLSPMSLIFSTVLAPEPAGADMAQPAHVRPPREYRASSRSPLAPGAQDRWEAILRVLDFGILSDFACRNSDFMTPHSWISIIEIVAYPAWLLRLAAADKRRHR
jgi:hypothetical protein